LNRSSTAASTSAISRAIRALTSSSADTPHLRRGPSRPSVPPTIHNHQGGSHPGREGYPKKLGRYHAHYATSLGGSGPPGRPVLFLVDHWKDPAWAARPGSPAYRRKQNEVLLERIAREARAADARAGRRLDVRLTTLLRASDEPEGLAVAVWSTGHDRVGAEGRERLPVRLFGTVAVAAVLVKDAEVRVGVAPVGYRWVRRLPQGQRVLERLLGLGRAVLVAQQQAEYVEGAGDVAVDLERQRAEEGELATDGRFALAVATVLQVPDRPAVESSPMRRHSGSFGACERRAPAAPSDRVGRLGGQDGPIEILAGGALPRSGAAFV